MNSNEIPEDNVLSLAENIPAHFSRQQFEDIAHKLEQDGWAYNPKNKKPQTPEDTTKNKTRYPREDAKEALFEYIRQLPEKSHKTLVETGIVHGAVNAALEAYEALHTPYWAARRNLPKTMNTPEPKEFTAIERNYWRHRALRAEEKLRDIATECELPPTYPPQPLIHTHIEDEDGTVYWYRLQDGWHCNNTNCTHCPTTWDHVISYNTDTHTYVFKDPHPPTESPQTSRYE